MYYLPDDFSQANNVAAEHSDKLKELQDLFWAEAEKYHVLPLLGGTFYAGMDNGRDNGMTVDPAYRVRAPYPFTGTVTKVVVDLTPAGHEDEKHLHEAAHHGAAAAVMSG